MNKKYISLSLGHTHKHAHKNRTYLYELHHGDWVEEVKAGEAVQPAGGAGDVRDGQGGSVAGKDGVSEEPSGAAKADAIDKTQHRQRLIILAIVPVRTFHLVLFYKSHQMKRYNFPL